MNRTPDDVRTALDTVLSGASHDPALFNCVVNASKGVVPPVKRKLHLVPIIAVLLLSLSITALAAGLSIPGLQDFFNRDNHFEYLFGVPPESIDASAIATPAAQQNTCTLVDMRVEQLYLTDEKLYFTVHYTPKEENTFLFSGSISTVTLDGEEVAYWELWDTDYHLYSTCRPQLNNPDVNEPYRYVEHTACYRDPETGAITDLYALPYTEADTALLDPQGGTLTLYCAIEDLRQNKAERSTLVIDLPPLTVVDLPFTIHPEE